MAEYCEICGERLDTDEEEEGVCSKCKNAKEEDDEFEKDENYIDPGIT